MVMAVELQVIICYNYYYYCIYRCNGSQFSDDYATGQYHHFDQLAVDCECFDYRITSYHYYYLLCY